MPEIDIRYIENIGNNYITEDMQKELLTKTVCVIGVGGSGSWVVNFLARLGVKKIICFDEDTLERQDLNLKCFSTENNLGEYKTEVCLKALKEINSSIEYEFYNFNYSKEYEYLIKDADIILNCADMDYETTMSFLDTFKNKDIFFLTGYVNLEFIQMFAFNLKEEQDRKAYKIILTDIVHSYSNYITLPLEKRTLSFPTYMGPLLGSFYIDMMLSKLFFKNKSVNHSNYNFIKKHIDLYPTYSYLLQKNYDF